MASLARPMLLRQLCAAPSASRGLSSTASAAFSSSSGLVRSQLRAAPLRSQFVRAALLKASRAALFHVTSRREILPPLPQTIQGTTNDPVPVPAPSPSHGSYHWTMERLVAASLIPLTVLPLASGSLHPITDGVFGALIVAHSHIGFQACIIDYFPAGRVPAVRRGLMWTLNLATVLVLIGLYEFETNDVGITEAVKRVWRA